MNYHFVWTPKYRRKVIVGNVEKRLKSLLKEKCKELKIDILSLETMPDHVHVFVRAEPTNYIPKQNNCRLERIYIQSFEAGIC
jgi:putative transposase